MIRAFWFMIQVAALIAVAVWLSDNPGTLAVNWLGYTLETSMSVAVVSAVVGAVGLIVLYRLLSAVLGSPAAFGRFRARRRREQGLEALTRGMVAVAAGDASAAQRMARRAEELLREPPLTRLLSAQAAQLRGDDNGAKRHFAAMLESPDTVFLGVRGLLTQALKDGDRVEALALARRAAKLQPDTGWVLGTLFDLEARAGEWAAAELTLRRAVQAGVIKQEDGRRHRAALLVERSFEAERRGREDAALKCAREAFELSPGFAPAATRYVRLAARAGNLRRANKAAMQAWRLCPTPELAAAFREVVDGYDAMSRVKTFEKLAAQAPQSVESNIAVARAALDAGLWGEARAELEKAREKQPSRRVFHLLADLERAENQDEDAARGWLLQELTAPEDPAWCCSACGGSHSVWAGLCGHCGSFDTSAWKTPTPPAGLDVARPAAQSLVVPVIARVAAAEAA
jgi:HemY protein